MDLEVCEKVCIGLFNLKVGYNCIYGYFIELLWVQVEQVLVDYICWQILKGVECFIMLELKVFEDKVLLVQSCVLVCEKVFYEELLECLIGYFVLFQDSVLVLVELDVLVNFVECVLNFDLNCLWFVEYICLYIEQGCYLVVEQVLEILFVVNDLVLDVDIWMLVIIGLNMGGKFIYMW